MGSGPARRRRPDRLYQRHLLITGLSNQGKTASLRALALWLALDRVGGVPDRRPQGRRRLAHVRRPRHVLIQGPTDDHVIDATEMARGRGGGDERAVSWRRQGTARVPPLVVHRRRGAGRVHVPASGEDKRPYGGSKATSRYFHGRQEDPQPGPRGQRDHLGGHAGPHRPEPSQAGPRGRPHPRLPRAGHRVAGPDGARETRPSTAAPPRTSSARAWTRGTLVVAGDGLEARRGQSSITVRTHYIDDDEAARSPTAPRPCAPESHPHRHRAGRGASTTSPTSPPCSGSRADADRRSAAAAR